MRTVTGALSMESTSTYDCVDALRRDAGIIGAAVNQVIGDPNQVVLYQAETEDALARFAGSAELKAAMQAGGVSAPQIRFMRSMPGAAY